MKKLIVILSVTTLFAYAVARGQQSPEPHSMATPPFQLGKADMIHGDFEDAVTDFGHAIDLDPKLPAAYNGRGFAKLHLMDVAGALADFNQAISPATDFGNAYYGRAEAEQMKGALDAAMDDYRKTIELSPQGSDNPHFLLWVVRVQLNQKDDADKELAAYMADRTKDPAHAWHNNVSDYLLGKISDKQFLDSTAQNDTAVNVQKATGDVYYFIGMKRLIVGDKNGAIDNLRKCVKTAEMTISVYPLAVAQMKALGAKP